MYRGFTLDNVIRTDEHGNIHYNLYVPEGYETSDEEYALFITLPGYGGLYFQGVGINLRREDFAFSAMEYDSQMIIAAPQLRGWDEESADQTIALTEYLLENYRIDRAKVYLEGMSGGGETGSIAVGKRPDLFTAYLAVSTRWDGSLPAVAEARLPVYMAIAENDTYYGSGYLEDAYETLRSLYESEGLSEEEIRGILVLDIRDDSFFEEQGYEDQHAGGMAFAHDRKAMGWFFSRE